MLHRTIIVEDTTPPVWSLARTRTTAASAEKSELFKGEYYFIDSTSRLESMPSVAEMTPSAVTHTTTIDYPTLAAFEADVPSIQGHHVAVVWTGHIKITKAGHYTFSTTSDDGSHLWIDGIRVVDNGGLHPAREATGVVALAAGTYPFKADFFENAGGETMVVKYSGPDTGDSQVLLASAEHHLSETPVVVIEAATSAETVFSENRPIVTDECGSEAPTVRFNVVVAAVTATTNAEEKAVYCGLNPYDGHNAAIAAALKATTDQNLMELVRTCAHYTVKWEAVDDAGVHAYLDQVSFDSSFLIHDFHIRWCS